MKTTHWYEPGEHIALHRREVLLCAPHILVAEGHPAIQELLRWALGLAGYRTTVCAGGHTAFTQIDLPSIGAS